jgi:diguanylate cyclase (GGDEF)-like protein/PAS domain S-box-containing protein
MNRRHIFYSLPVILLLIVAVAGWFTTNYLGNKARQEIIEESRASALTLSIYVSSTLNKFEEAVKSLSGSPWIAPALLSKLSKGKRDIEHANSALDRYNSALNASVSYLMDDEGMTVASSNRNDPDSFVGKSYRFRPYFQEASKGNASRYYALGVTSGKRGFYASYPVQSRSGKVVGVVTIKKDLDDMEAFFSKYPFCFFISPDGIIFLSSAPAMVLKSLWLLDKTAQERLIVSRQFGDKPFDAVFLKKEIADGIEINLEGNDYLVSKKMIQSHEWSIVLLTPTNHIKVYKLIGILTTISVCLLILIFSGVLYATDRSKEAIRQSEESKRLLLHAAGEGIFGVDATGRLTFINPAALLMLGFTEEELLGQRVHNLIHHTHADGSNYPVEDCPMYASYTTATECHVMDEVLWRKDGSSFPVEYSSMPITKDGKVMGAVVTFKDITERKKADEEKAILAEIGRVIGSTLEIDEVYDRFAAETKKLIPFDNLIINLINKEKNELVITYVSGMDIPSRRKRDLLPFEGSIAEMAVHSGRGIILPSENLPENVNKYPSRIHVHNAGLLSMLSAPLISSGEVFGVLVFRSKKPNAYTKQDLRLAERIGAQIAGAIGSAHLFAELRKTEGALRESEGRFRGLFEQAAVGVAEIEVSTGRFITVNNRLCEMVGRTEEELMATTFLAITHPEDLHLHEEKTALLLAGKIRSYTLEKRYLRKDEESVWVNLTTSSLWKPGEKPGRNMIVVEDITERKRMEGEILALSITDQLTGLHNRRGFLSLAGQQLKLAERSKSGMLLFFADLDGLKWINDTLGHEEGDKALIEAATVLKETFRTSDIIARLGGDEYAALAVDITEANSEIFTARLQSLIDTRNNQENRRYRLSISVGCSYYDPENPCTLDELIAHADQLMYEQKQYKKGLLLQEASLSSKQ